MSTLVILLIFGIGFIIVVVSVIFLFMMGGQRQKGKQKLQAVDSVGNLVFVGLSRRKWIQPHGDGHEAFPFGFGKKPISLSGRTYEVPFANCTLNINQSFLEKLKFYFNTEKCTVLEYENNRLESELSSVRADLFKLQSETGRIVDSGMDKTVGHVKKLMPVMMMKKSGNRGTGGGGYNG